MKQKTGKRTSGIYAFLYFLFTTLLLLPGCNEYSPLAERNNHIDISNARHIERNIDNVIARSGSHNYHLGQSDMFPGSERASARDFSISLFSKGKIQKSGKAQGLSPQDRKISQSYLEMNTTEPIDEVIDYYVRRYRDLKIRELRTDTGRMVIISDYKSIMPFLDSRLKSGTTLTISRDENKSDKPVYTKLVYSSFSFEKQTEHK